MSEFPCYNLIKRSAKALAKSRGIKLSEAQEQLARHHRFSDFHELTTVAKRNAEDPRLIGAVIGMDDWSDLLYSGVTWAEFNERVEDALASEMAETNAHSFQIEDVEILNTECNAGAGIVLLTVAFNYSGEQDPDKTFFGNSFDVQAVVRLALRNDTWELLSENGLEIVVCERSDARERYQEEAGTSF